MDALDNIKIVQVKKGERKKMLSGNMLHVFCTLQHTITYKRHETTEETTNQQGLDVMITTDCRGFQPFVDDIDPLAITSEPLYEAVQPLLDNSAEKELFKIFSEKAPDIAALLEKYHSARNPLGDFASFLREQRNS